MTRVVATAKPNIQTAGGGQNAAHFLMKPPDQNPEDPKLSRTLRSARPEPTLPPRFQEGVWRRIVETELPVCDARPVSWLDALVALVLRPRFALATVALLICAGAVLGVREAGQTARHDAQARYVAAVAPNSLR